MTGIAGLTLGGGIGWLNGRYGLACDNLLEADVVTADGDLVKTNADQHEDLYWAIRGGGGNFGVVTSFTYQLHPVSTVIAGGVSFPPSRARDALRFYHEFACQSPDELTTAASVGLDGDGLPVVSIAVCYCGPVEASDKALHPLREFAGSTIDAISPTPYLEFQSAQDAGFPSGRHHYWKSSIIRDVTDDAIDTLLSLIPEMPSPLTGVGLQEVGGVASRVPPAATAFPHRGHCYDFLILSQWEDPGENAINVAWTQRLFDAMQPFLERAVYANNLGDEGADRVQAAYGVNYERLASVKVQCDPTNLFRLNHNIKPATNT
jgi:FAD/FMN-containing dehydrogenase